MNDAVSISARFRMARERAGLSVAETAARAGVSEPCVLDLETYEDELMTVYSPADLKRFAAALSVAPRELVGVEVCSDPISAFELASAIREHCRVTGVALDSFGEAVGWDVMKAVESPQLLYTDFSLDGIRDLCRSVSLDWQSFVTGLLART